MYICPFLPLHTWRHDEHAVQPPRVATLSCFSFAFDRVTNPASDVDVRPILHTFNVHPNEAALLLSQPFEQINGRIRLKSRLDREDYVRKRLCLGGNNIVSIEISDVNDSPPRFESSVHNVTLAENNLHSQERSSGSFRLDRNIGVLTLAQALDYERHKSYQLHVVVIDRQVNPVRDSCTVNISVLDHSPSTKMRFNPIFEHDQDGTMAYVKGSFDIHLLSAFVNVHDEDEGGHGQAQLSVEPSRWFYLEVLRPKIVRIPPDQAACSRLRSGNFAPFELNIIVDNDQRKMFKTNHKFDVSENNRVPMIIGRVYAADSDQVISE